MYALIVVVSFLWIGIESKWFALARTLATRNQFENKCIQPCKCILGQLLIVNRLEYEYKTRMYKPPVASYEPLQIVHMKPVGA